MATMIKCALRGTKRFILSNSSVIQQFKISPRSLFTDRFMGLTEVQETRQRNLEQLQILNEDKLKKSIMASGDRGLLLSTDLDKIYLMVKNKEDLQIYQKLILKYLELTKNNKIVRLTAAKHFHRYLQLVHIIGTADMALDMFDIWTAQMTDDDIGMTNSHLLLVNILATKQMWSHVVEVYQKLDINTTHTSSNNLITLALLGLVKMNQPDSYNLGTQLVEQYFNSDHKCDPAEIVYRLGEGRATLALAWLAHLAGENDIAYEILMVSGKLRSIDRNMEILFLLEMDKLEEAVDCLKSMVNTEDVPDWNVKRKPQLCREVILKMVEMVNVGKEDEEKMMRVRSNLKHVFMLLDQSATLIDNTIEDLLFSPIDVIEKRKQRSKTPMESIVGKYKPKGNTGINPRVPDM